jgi:D-inositol-3-phosphate glycosyltransferase
VVLFVGRIQALKGLAVATKAIALLSGATRSGQALFVVVGGPSGPRGEEELANAKAIAERSGLGGRVRWVPAIPHELLSSHYRAADVCVVPSWSESFGLVALEASACAVPVVASAVGGLADLVDHGRTGYLVAPGDVEGFAHYLKELLEDMALARLMGAAALEASSPYTWPAAATRFSELIASLAGRDLVNCG